MTSARTSRQSGSALLIVLIMMVVVLVLCLATLLVGSTEAKSADVAKKRVQALYVAEAGVERQIRSLNRLLTTGGLPIAYAVIDGLVGAATFEAETLTKDGTSVGQFTVTVTAVEAPDDSTRDVTVVSRGYVPSADAANRVARTVTATLRLQTCGGGAAFAFAYFIHAGGRVYGKETYVDGNVGSNGRFDCGTTNPKIDIVQRYQRVVGTDLQGLIDAGGMDAGWEVIADAVEGEAKRRWSEGDFLEGRCTEDQIGQFRYQREFQDPVPLPQAFDLAQCEGRARSQGSSIKVGSTTVCGPVMGDDPGEPQHLYLRGTATNPIVLNGLVVVRGSVIISGVVRGQGTIYAGGNIYVPQDLTYENAPQPLPNPSTRTESSLENWLKQNTARDALGLFAGEHIVVGDYTNATWRSYVQTRLQDPANMSREDAGLDRVPNTKAGRDGILGTADDDVLEDDGLWAVERYTQEDAAEGLIPPGKSVGDPIPGTGEDVDGDGVYDGPITLSQFDIPAPLTAANWAGNLPEGQPLFSTIASTGITRLHAAFSSSHAFAMMTDASKKDFALTGCIVARNDAIYFDMGNKPRCLYYDFRLMAGSEQFGYYLPQTRQPIRVLLWTSD